MRNDLCVTASVTAKTLSGLTQKTAILRAFVVFCQVVTPTRLAYCFLFCFSVLSFFFMNNRDFSFDSLTKLKSIPFYRGFVLSNLYDDRRDNSRDKERQ